MIRFSSLVLLCFISFCPAQEPFESKLNWTPRFQGIDHAELSAKSPRLMRGHALRIDLTAPGIELVTTAPMADQPSRTAGLKTSTFLTKERCQAAINGCAFSPIHAEEGKEQILSGLHVSRGKIVSKGNGKYHALLVSKGNKAWVAEPPFELKDVYNAVGGFQIVLKGGKVPEKMPDYNRGPVHPRSAAGVSADGRYLYLLVIDGRQKDWSQGASIQEVGMWLKALGANEGINLDGGGTTTLVMADGEGNPKVLNRPIHGPKPGTERVAGSHLGVKAKALAKSRAPSRRHVIPAITGASTHT
jgi:hypothetical protein